MAQEPSNPTQWQEPDKGQNAGIGSWNRPNSPYDNFMESEGVPIYRGIGVTREHREKHQEQNVTQPEKQLARWRVIENTVNGVKHGLA